jgi:protein-tyrosine phosphatase
VDVPDPYYGDDDDFEHCLDLIEAGCRGLVTHLDGRAGSIPVR